jgi:rare lipoprotein A
MRWTVWLATGLMLAGGIASADAAAQTPKRISGIAAFYDTNYKGRTASGERYDPNKFTAAHKTLPFGTRLLVTDIKTKRSVVVVINDRGPFTKGRVIDLSLAAAKALRMTVRGLIKVSFAPEPAEPFKTAAQPAAR